MSSGLYSGVSGLALGTGLYRNVSGLWGGSSGLIDAFGGGGGPFPGASLYLDFLTPPLDSRITFSRGTNATLVDSTGKITYAPANLVLWSQDFSNAAWAATTATKTSGVLDPLGGTTASTITATAGNGQILQSVSGSAGTSQAYVSSIWLRRRTGTGAVWLFNPNGAGITAVSLTTSWAQYSVVGFGAAATNFAGIRLATSGDEVDVAFAQLEPVTYQTTPGPYVATTASPYYGPRFDYDPVTLAPRGLLIEEARTNLLTYSDDWSNAAWTKQQVTITTNATLSPDGTANADKIVEDSSTAFHRAFQTITKAASAITYTYTVFVKAAERTTASVFMQDSTVFAQVDINLLTGALSNIVGTVSATNFGNGWWRVSVSGTSGTVTTALCMVASNNGGSFAGTAGFGIYAYGAQLEAGAFATSYIPTVASTVSRSADVAAMTGTNFSTWWNASAGTFVAAFDMTTVDIAARHIVWAISDAGNNRLSQRATEGGQNFPSAAIGTGSTVITLNGSAITANTNVNVATAYGADMALVQNGATPVTNASASSVVGSSIAIGSNPAGGAYLNGHIRAIAYYNTRLPNTQLQTLTAPSLASPLALDFLSTTYTVGY
jgi:hypothetical protein